MKSQSGSASAEKFLAASVVISLLIAAVASLIPALSFGSLRTMVLVLVVSDLVLYALMRMGAIRPGRSAD